MSDSPDAAKPSDATQASNSSAAKPSGRGVRASLSAASRRTAAVRPLLRKPGHFVQQRIRLGARRVARSIVPALQMTICATSAYAFAEFVLGHDAPIFAATSSLIALGFSREKRIRRVVEVALGCTLGIIMGEIVWLFLGGGIWSAALVLFLSILLARFIDRGGIFATQLGLQSVLVIFLPEPVGGPFTRSLDAVIGGCFALVVALLTPRDPRREPQQEMQNLLSSLSEVIRECAQALQENNSQQAWHALIRARNTQSAIDNLRNSLISSKEIARISPVYRKYRHDIGSLEHALEYIDYAVRNSRVFARRLSSTLTHDSLDSEIRDQLAHVVTAVAEACYLLAIGLGERDEQVGTLLVHEARKELKAAAKSLHPQSLGGDHLEGEALVMILRPLVVDLLEASALDHDDARNALPDL